MEKVKKEKQEKEKKQGKQKQEKPKHEYEDYMIFLHKQKVELHVNYGGTILKLEGILRAKARYNIQLILDEKKKEVLTINKAYVVLVKPL